VTVSFAGRVEALFRVPTGGAAASVSSGALTSAVTVTTPAASYFHTAAGGISSWATTFQTQLNTNVLPFPDNAASLAAAIGYGVWTTGAGWLMQEASGTLAASFGSPSLTAVSSPTYRNSGTTTGDYAVGFDSAADAFSGGDVFDATATDDLVVAWVGKCSSSSSLFDLMGKWSGAGAGWLIYENSGTIIFASRDGVDQITPSCGSNASGSWHVGIAVLDRTNNLARVGICPLGGSPTVSASTASTLVGTLANASSLTVGASGGFGAPTDFLCSAMYVVSGTSAAGSLVANLSTALTNFASAINSSFTVSLSATTGLYTISNSFWTYGITWSDTNQRDLAGFTGNLSGATTNTATTHARGLWLPDCNLNIDDDPRTAPVQNDLRQTQSPTGAALGLCGNEFYEHTNCRWEMVPIAQYREASATVANGSLETFWRDTQAGTGHSWFRPCSPVQIYYDQAGVQTAVGSDESIDGWYIAGVGGIRSVAKKHDPNWTGYWTVTFPRLVSDG
jgi:hypothetical protein